MTIPDEFRREVLSLDWTATPIEAANMMKDSGVGALVLTVDGRPRGMLTDRDLALGVLAADEPLDRGPVGRYGTGTLEAVPETAELVDVVQLMRSQLVRRVPVVDAAGALVGIITSDDLIARFGDDLGAAVAAMRAGFDYEAAPPAPLNSVLGRE